VEQTSPTQLASYRIAEVLRESEKTTVCRAVDPAGHKVVLKILAPQWTQPREVERLEREYRMAVGVASPAVVKPIAFERYEGRPALVLEDFAGTSLDRLIDGRMALGRFLHIGIAVAAALAEVHRRGIIHKDIKPANLVVNEATGEVKIADFGIASRLPREHQAPRNPALMEGTLAYMSPEQTGRMNRAMDQRTDLYSLGVTFYEMLTGTLPFAPRDQFEWVHCHIARVPAAPADVVPGIPAAVSDIVTKLLAKTAEDRYQSARGLKHDLETCLRAWESAGYVDPFPLGQRDASDHLVIPQKLYGRERELAVLHESFGRVAATGVPEVVLVSGQSGVGKSSLVRELRAAVVREGGLFLAGKCDAHKGKTPYAAIVQAFRELILDLLTEGDQQIALWRQRLQHALGPNGQLIVSLISPLELVIGPQPPVAALGPADAQARFFMVFERFIAAFASKDRPLVLSLDDLQWADAGSLALIELIASGRGPLLVVGTYREKELDPSHPLAQAIERLRAGARLVELSLGPLATEHIQDLLAEALHWDAEEARPVAALVARKTGGNAFFAIQFLSTLYEEGVLEFDETSEAWRCDLAKLDAQGFTDNIADLMATRVSRLPAAARDILLLAAYAGNATDVGTLASLRHQTEQEVHEALTDAVREGLLERRGSSYRFAHDRIRQAAYLLVPEGDRAALHLRIGRELLRRVPVGAVPDAVFEVVDQLDRAESEISDSPERLRAAELNLVAARKASASNAHAAALEYLRAAEAFLGSERRQHPELAVPLALERADCELLDGRLAEAEHSLAVLLEEATTAAERAGIYRRFQWVHLAAGNIGAAVGDELVGLGACGIELPVHPTTDDVAAARLHVQRLVAQHPTGDLTDLPPLNDPRKEAALEITTPSVFVDPKLFFLHVARMVALSLEEGIGDASSYFFGNYGIALAGLGDYADARRFAGAGRALAARRGLLSREAEASFCLGTVAFWTDPIDGVLAEFRNGIDAGLRSGHVTAAAYSACCAVLAALIRGSPLQEVDRMAEPLLAFTRKAQQRDSADVILFARQFVRRLAGETRALSTFEDDAFSEARFEAALTPDRMSLAVCWYWTFKLWASYLSGDYADALAAGARARPLLWAAQVHAPHRNFRLYEGLTLAALLPTASPERQAEWTATLGEHSRLLRDLAELNPPTFRHAHALLSAELARLEGRNQEAVRLYDQGIASARENGFIHEEALGHELAARFYTGLGGREGAAFYWSEAHRLYRSWGAFGKASQIERQFPRLAKARPIVPTETYVAPPEQMDVHSVIRASQALSGEVHSQRLLRTLLEVVLEQSGAERAYLLLVRDGALSVVGEALASARGTEVRALELPVASPSLLPASLVQYVWRTGETVISDDLAGRSRFAGDSYIIENAPRSVLCLQLRHQAGALGVLYLENRTLRGAFPPQRLAAVEVLAAQAAISVENVRHLERERAARERSELFAEASALLSESLEIGVILTHLCRLLVRTLADWCVVDLVENNQIRRAAQAHADETKEALIVEMRERYPARWDSPQPVAQVIRTGQPVLLPEVSAEMAGRYTVDEGHLGIVRGLGVRSAMVIPLRARGHVLGALTVVSARAERPLGQAEREVIEELARRAAIAVDNAQLYQQTREAVRMRDEFLSVASHELNTPMTALMLNLEALLMAPRKGLSPDRVLSMIGLAERQGRRLTRLIRELLDVTRLERGAIALEREEVELGTLVRGVVARFSPELNQAGCAVSVDAPDPVVGRWEPMRLEQVVLNLLSNASKFGKGKPIEVRVERRGGIASLSVTDHGIGIHPAHQQRIFERFERGVSATHYGGLGLGLYVCRGLIQAHGGTIRVESQPDQGATFIVELPLQDA
jgi:predicted ATPase/signal transduction histidine kinase/tRNA A-37 threonylcarbamoyl transferase component Bud32